MTPYIGFAGPKTAGKTTAARLLINKLRNDNITVAKFSLASPIRDMLATLLSRCLEEEEIEKYMHDQEYKEQPIPGLGVSYRRLATTLGTEWGRELIREDLWIKLAELSNAKMNTDVYICDDIRFIEERDFIKKNNGVVIYIQPVGFSGSTQAEHPSEQFNISLADIVITNKKRSPLELEEELLSVLKLKE